MAGWSGEEALTAQAGPCSFGSFGCVEGPASALSSAAFRFPLPPLMTLFKLPYAD